MATSLAAGLDVGGTRIKAALVEPRTGWVVAEAVVSTPTKDLPSFLSTVGELADRLRLSAVGAEGISAWGVALPGLVDGDRVSDVWDSLKFLNGSDVAPTLRDLLGTRVVLDNDARVVALGEANFGGHGIGRLLSLTLGTGLGVAMAVGGCLLEHTSVTHMAGHIPIRPGATDCFCGISGCLESLLGAARLGENPAATLADDGVVTERYLKDLTAGLNAYVHLYAPDVIVLGGGLAQGLRRHLPALAGAVVARPFKGYRFRVVVSDLAERAGSLGAAVLTLDGERTHVA